MESSRPFHASVLVFVCMHMMRKQQGFGRSKTLQATR